TISRRAPRSRNDLDRGKKHRLARVREYEEMNFCRIGQLYRWCSPRVVATSAPGARLSVLSGEGESRDCEPTASPTEEKPSRASSAGSSRKMRRTSAGPS